MSRTRGALEAHSSCPSSRLAGFGIEVAADALLDAANCTRAVHRNQFGVLQGERQLVVAVGGRLGQTDAQ